MGLRHACANTNNHTCAKHAIPHQAKGYGVAIASANSDTTEITPVLKRIDGATFDAAFYASPAFQYGRGDKTAQLRAIAEHFGTQTACVMLFDNSEC